MTNLKGAAANITRPDKITAKERDEIIAMTREHPHPVGDRMIAEKFGRSPRTIEALRAKWQKAENVPHTRKELTPINEPFRQNAALDFAKKYGKSFTIRTAAEYMGEYTGYAPLFNRLAKKGYFTTRNVKLHKRCKDGSMRRIKCLIITPTAQLLEE